jgi:hypothetical protein
VDSPRLREGDARSVFALWVPVHFPRGKRGFKILGENYLRVIREVTGK